MQPGDQGDDVEILDDPQARRSVDVQIIENFVSHLTVCHLPSDAEYGLLEKIGRAHV